MNTKNHDYVDVVYNEVDRPLTEYPQKLASTWRGMTAIVAPLAEITRLLVPLLLKKRSKWVRFSKEIMLLASSRNPMRSIEGIV